MPRSRLRARDIGHPFHGVYVQGDVDGSFLNRLEAYRARMPDDEFFSHSTAARVLGIPLPGRLEAADELDVSVLAPARPPEGRGIRGHELQDASVIDARGFRIASPADVWCQLASLLGVRDLVAAGDYVVTGPDPFHGAPPLATLARLRAAVDRHAGHRGVRSLRAALDLVRPGAMSRKETQLRLLLRDAGLPEPDVNYAVEDATGRTIVIDLAYPALRIGLEYEGDWHRTDRAKFLTDITRRERLADIAWSIIRVTSHDMRDPLALVNRIQQRIRAASPGKWWV